MFYAAICLFFFVIFSLIVSFLTMNPMEELKRYQPEYYDTFGSSLIPFSPMRIVFTLVLVLGDYKKNINCTKIIEQLDRARMYAVFQLVAFVLFFVSVYLN